MNQRLELLLITSSPHFPKLRRIDLRAENQFRTGRTFWDVLAIMSAIRRCDKTSNNLCRRNRTLRLFCLQRLSLVWSQNDKSPPTTNHRHDGENPRFSQAYLQNLNAANAKSPKYIGVHFPGPADGPSQAREHKEEQLQWCKWKVSKT